MYLRIDCLMVVHPCVQPVDYESLSITEINSQDISDFGTRAFTAYPG